MLLITNHLDLIFHHLLTWFHLRGRHKKKGQILHKWRVGLFCQHAKKRFCSLTKPQQKASNTFKMAHCHLAREIRGWQQAGSEQLCGESASAQHTEEECWTARFNLHVATWTALVQENEEPWRKIKIPLAAARYKNTRCSFKTGAKYTWHIWKAGQLEVPGRKWNPDRGVTDSVWLKANEGLVSTASETYHCLHSFSVKDLGCLIPELYIFPTN